MILVDGNDNSIEYYEILNQCFFKSKLNNYYPIRIRIVLSYAFRNRKGKIFNYRTNGYIQHNHTKEALERNNAELE